MGVLCTANEQNISILFICTVRRDDVCYVENSIVPFISSYKIVICFIDANTIIYAVNSIEIHVQ